MSKSTYENFIAEPQNRRILAQEELILEATESLARVLKATGKTKAELAETLGKSNAFVTQVLSGTRNMTIRTFADFLFVMGFTARMSEAPIHAPRLNLVTNNIFVQEPSASPSDQVASKTITAQQYEAS